MCIPLIDVVGDAAHDGILAVNASGLITFVNQAATNILGFPAEKLIHQPIHEVLHLDNDASASACQACAMLRDGKTYRNYTGTFRRHDDTTVAVSCNIVPFPANGNARGAVIAFKQIGEHEETAQDRQLHRTTAEDAPVSIAADGGHSSQHFTKGLDSWLHISKEDYKKKAGDLQKPLSVEHLLAVIEDATDFVATADAHGRILYYNKAARRMLGIPDDEDVTGTNVADTRPEWAARLLLEQWLPTAARDGSWEGEAVLLTRDGREIPVWQVIVAHKNGADEVEYFSTIARDATEYRLIQERLRYVASHDGMTGLMNRARFQEELRQELNRAARADRTGALLYIDLDNFKEINDRFGHAKGNEVLQRVARVLEEHLRVAHVLARLGGDEFGVLLPDVSLEDAEQIGRRLLEILSDEVVVNGEHKMALRASIGVAMYPYDANTVRELLVNADTAMYAAKRAGGGNLVMYANTMTRGTPRCPKEWENRCRHALKHNLFVLYRQPLIDMTTRRVSAWEFLIRMKDDDGQLIMPGEFLPTAERTGLIVELDRWVMRNVFHLLAHWPELRDDTAAVHINLSRKTLSDEGLLEFVQAEVEKTNIDPARIVFELTETAAIDDLDRAIQFMEAMQEMGFRFALDDFGVGFSAFGALRRLPVDYLKIDGSFVRDFRYDRVNQHLVQAVIDVARGLGKHTVAEFIPDEETLQLLREAGADYGQGYYIGRPEAVPMTPAP